MRKGDKVIEDKNKMVDAYHFWIVHIHMLSLYILYHARGHMYAISVYVICVHNTIVYYLIL
jgi:hypothetical protein